MLTYCLCIRGKKEEKKPMLTLSQSISPGHYAGHFEEFFNQNGNAKCQFAKLNHIM